MTEAMTYVFVNDFVLVEGMIIEICEQYQSSRSPAISANTIHDLHVTDNQCVI